MATPLSMKSPAEILGARLLQEIEREEGSLESLLKDLRTHHPTPRSKTGIPPLDKPTHHPITLSITGRNLPLLNHILQHQIRTLHGTTTLIDLTSTFSPSHLIPHLNLSELTHIHIFRCTKSNLKVTMEGLERYMMGCKLSQGREWVGTVVLGGNGGDVNFGWRGMWRVERVSEGEAFGEAVSVEEAVEERRARREAMGGTGGVGEVRGVRWKVVGDGGEYSWRSG